MKRFEPSSGVTIAQVAAGMGRDLDARTAWAVGRTVALCYEDRTGQLPTKELRPKAAGRGSHCLATYPPEWIPTIRVAILNHLGKRSPIDGDEALAPEGEPR